MHPFKHLSGTSRENCEQRSGLPRSQRQGMAEAGLEPELLPCDIVRASQFLESGYPQRGNWKERDLEADQSERLSHKGTSGCVLCSEHHYSP